MKNGILAIVLVLPLAIAPTDTWASGETPTPPTSAAGACNVPKVQSTPCGNDAACAMQKKVELEQQLEAHNRCMEQLARDTVSPVTVPAQ